MKHWEQALEYATSVQAGQPEPASAGRFRLERNLNHPAALTHTTALNQPDALTHCTAGMAPTDIGLFRDPEPDIEPEK